MDAGARIVPIDDISKDDLHGQITNLEAAPLRGSMLRGSPLRGSMLRGSPLRGSMLRGSPLRGSMLRGSPLRGSPIPLSQVPLDLPNTWAAVLAGTIYANQPLQNVTLQQVLELDPPGLTGLTLADIDISQTPLRNVSLAAIMLGSTPVSALDAQDKALLPQHLPEQQPARARARRRRPGQPVLPRHPPERDQLSQPLRCAHPDGPAR